MKLKYECRDDIRKVTNVSFKKDDVHEHKRSLKLGVSNDTRQRQREIVDIVVRGIERVNSTMTEEQAREWTDRLECRVNTPEFAFRRPRVNCYELTPGQIVCALTSRKKRFCMVIRNDTKRKVVTLCPLVSFRDDFRSRAALDTNEYFISTEPVSERNNFMSDRHFYKAEKMHFVNGGKNFDGFVDTNPEHVVYADYDEVLKVMKVNDEAFSQDIYKNVRASFIAKKKQKEDAESAAFIETLMKELNEFKRKEGVAA